MHARRGPWRGALAGLVAAAVTATTTAGCGSDPGDEGAFAGAEVTGDVTGRITVDEKDEVAVPAASIAGVHPVTEVVDVATDGEVTGEVQVRVPLTRTTTWPTDDAVFALTAGTAEGPWVLVPAEVDGGRGEVVITATDLALFQAFRTSPRTITEVAHGAWERRAGDPVTDATAPRCDDEDGAGPTATSRSRIRRTATPSSGASAGRSTAATSGWSTIAATRSCSRSATG
jgi:hypothetical protein